MKGQLWWPGTEGTSAHVHLAAAPQPGFVFAGVTPVPLSLPELPHQDTRARQGKGGDVGRSTSSAWMHH